MIKNLKVLRPYLIILAFALVVFSGLFMPGTLLSNSDSNIGSIVARNFMFPGAFLGHFCSCGILGYATVRSFNTANVLLDIMPADLFNNWIYGVYLLFASFFLMKFLALKKIGVLPRLFAAITAFWIGTNFSLLAAGHIGKFAVLLFVSIALFCIEKSVLSGSLLWSILAGGAIGEMFIEQQDVALFCGLFLGAYAVYAIAMRSHADYKTMAKILIPMPVVAIILSGYSIIGLYLTTSTDLNVLEKNNQKANWSYSTQWSVPPCELIDFVAPGYMGWQSNAIDGPYWGKTGRSDAWEKTKQGFRNFRIESVYVGAIPVIFALFAIFVSIVNLRQGAEKQKTTESLQPPYNINWDGVFWGSALVVALLLSFGKYFPLYSLFYKIPGISSIRCPNKFLHIFQIILAILSAYGLDYLLKSKGTLKGRKYLIFIFLVEAFAVIMFLCGFNISASSAKLVEHFTSEGWGQFSSVIVKNMMKALYIGGGLTAIGGLTVWLVGMVFKDSSVRFSGVLTGCVLAVVMCDAAFLSKHYVKVEKKKSIVGETIVTDFLKSKTGADRVLFLSRSSFYNNWLSVLFPYYHIPTYNPITSVRLESGYRRFMNEVGKNPLRMWQLASVRYAMAPLQVWKQIQNTPQMKDSFKSVLVYNVFPENGGIGVSAGSVYSPGQHLILELKDSLPYYSLIGSWRVVSDADVCRELVSPLFDPMKQVLVADEFEGKIPVSQTLPDGINVGRVMNATSTSRTMTIKINANAPSILRISQKYYPGWIARVDGVRADVLRCDFLAIGVMVDKGTHTVELLYSPSHTGLWVQGFALLLCLLAGVSLIFKKIKMVRCEA